LAQKIGKNRKNIFHATRSLSPFLTEKTPNFLEFSWERRKEWNLGKSIHCQIPQTLAI